MTTAEVGEVQWPPVLSATVPVLPGWVSDVLVPIRTYHTPEEQVGLAIELARQNVIHVTGGPFGAAVFDESGTVLGVGVNRVEKLKSSVAHAEVVALARAEHNVGRARLGGAGEKYTLAASGQPCCQCYGALIWAGVDALLVGSRAGDAVELAGLPSSPLPADWIRELSLRRITVTLDVRRGAACEVLSQYGSRGGIEY